MKSKMNVLGVAPYIAAPTFLYMALAVVITFLSGEVFKITSVAYKPLVIAGILMIFTGTLMVIYCGRKLPKSFNSGKLMTDGLYKTFRNPMYAASLVFIIPGIALLFNSWLTLTTVLINYFLFSVFIKREYVYLYEKFGMDYDDYLTKVLIKFL